MALLGDIAASLNQASNVTEAMQVLLPTLSQVLDLKSLWVFQYNSRRATFHEVGASGLPEALSCNQHQALGPSWCECQERLAQGRLKTAINVVRCSRLESAQGDTNGLVYHASVPLTMDGVGLGILNVAAPGDAVFTKPSLDLLRTIGYHVAVTLERAALLTHLQRYNVRLRAVTEMAGFLGPVGEAPSLLQGAADLLRDRVGYEAIGWLRDNHLVYAALPKTHSNPGYCYRQDHRDPHPDRILMDDALAVIRIPIPTSPYTLVVESRFVDGLDEWDGEVLQAFTWYLQAHLEQIRIRRQAIANARRAERNKLAADLHDSVSQRLFSAHLLARTLHQRLAAHPTGHVAARLEEVIGESQTEMRHLISAFGTLNEPLPDLLESRIERLQKVLGPQSLVFERCPDHPIYSKDMTETVQHILDEALQNAMKHAPDATIHVAWEAQNGCHVLTIADTGPGFNPQSVKPGMGLMNMQQRAWAYGLKWSLESRPGQGTTIQLVIGDEQIHG